MVSRRLLVALVVTILSLLEDRIADAESWEVKRSTGHSYTPQVLFAISLEDHNSAFISSSYCVDEEGVPISYIRELCDECPSCVWKRRSGISTEAEWQTAVAAEMERMHGQGGSGAAINNNSLSQEEEEIVGSWIAEAPFTMLLNDVFIEELASSLGISLQNRPVISEMGDRGYFLVSGTPSSVKGLLSAGFSTLTPVLPRLKVDPVLEEEAAAAATAAAAAAAATSGGDAELLSGNPQQVPTAAVHSLRVQLAPRPPPPPALILQSGNSTNTATTAPSRAQLLSSSWTGVISSQLGHTKAQVLAEGADHVTIQGLQTKSELYRVALTVASHGDVRWVGREVRMAPSNLFASQMVQSGRWWLPEAIGAEIPDSYHPLSALGLTGKGEVVGIADTGIDFDSCYFKDEKIKPDFKDWDTATRMSNNMLGRYDIWNPRKEHRKIRQYVAYMNDKEDEEDGHGTHIAGSIAGSMSEHDVVFREYQGVAPDAKIAFFDIYNKAAQDDGYDSNFMFPPDIGKDMFDRAYGVGARIYVMSYNEDAPRKRGGGRLSPYSDLARGIDEYCHKHQNFIVFVSAGNQADQMQLPPAAERPEGYTITSPAEAKNAVTVGSHYNPTREAGIPPAGLKSYAIAPNSARGPTFDGRIKPDVCGPGHSVVSAASFPSDPSQSIVEKDGTSSANAVVAGATVLVRQYFTKGLYPDGKKKRLKFGFKPMGALLKAILVNSGQELSTGWSSATGGRGGPNILQGFGGVNLKSTLVTPASRPALKLKVYGKHGGGKCHGCPYVMGSSESRLYDLQITKETDDLPLKITLVWFDKPTEVGARKVLVNDLDLSVAELKSDRQPDPEAIYYANGGDAYDTVNTVEHIVIPSPKAGKKYLIRVKAGRIPYKGYQTFALVISGPFHRDKVSRSKMDSPSKGVGTPARQESDVTPERTPYPVWPDGRPSPPSHAPTREPGESERQGRRAITPGVNRYPPRRRPTLGHLAPLESRSSNYTTADF